MAHLHFLGVMFLLLCAALGALRVIAVRLGLKG